MVLRDDSGESSDRFEFLSLKRSFPEHVVIAFVLICSTEYRIALACRAGARLREIVTVGPELFLKELPAPPVING